MGTDLCLFILLQMKRSFQQLNHIRDHIQRIKNSPNVPILICANKCDLSGERAVSSESGQALARSLNPDQNDKKINYIETSAKTPQNVEEAFNRLVELTYRRPEKEAQTSCCVIS